MNVAVGVCTNWYYLSEDAGCHTGGSGNPSHVAEDDVPWSSPDMCLQLVMRDVGILPPFTFEYSIIDNAYVYT